MSGGGRQGPGAGGQAVSPELRRPFAVARVGAGTRFVVEATAEERHLLAGRMGVEAIDAFSCRFDLRPAEAHVIEATCLLSARVRQTCVVTLEPFDAEIEESFSVRFVPEGRLGDDIDIEAEDELPYEGGVLELGEAASEQLALVLDPFPRRPGAELSGELTMNEQPHADGAFAALGKLQRPN